MEIFFIFIGIVVLVLSKLYFNNFFLSTSIGEALEDSKLEAGMENAVPPAAAPIMKELSQLASEVAQATKEDKVSATGPIWDRGVVLVKQLSSKLTDPTQKNVVDNLLEPWMKKFRMIVKSGKATPENMNTYYTEKNAMLKAVMELSKGVRGK